jgi:hypothetical protein
MVVIRGEYHEDDDGVQALGGGHFEFAHRRVGGQMAQTRQQRVQVQLQLLRREMHVVANARLRVPHLLKPETRQPQLKP